MYINVFEIKSIQFYTPMKIYTLEDLKWDKILKYKTIINNIL